MRFLFSLLIAIVFCLPAHAAGNDMDAFRGFKRLRAPIDLSTVTFVTPLGASSDFGLFKGKWVLLNIWATWCAPCIAELPMLGDLAARKPFANMDVIAVSFDTNKSQAEIKDFLAAHKIGEFASYLDDQFKLSLALKSQGLPMTYLVDPNGKVIVEYRGATDWRDPKIVQALSFFVNSGMTSNKSPTSP